MAPLPPGMAASAARGTRPAFDLRSHLYRMTGVDLTRIDGVDGFTALKVSAKSART